MDADTGRVLLHRGQSAHPGRAHGDRGRHRPRHREGADPHRRGRPHRRRCGARPASRRRARSASRPRAAMPDHHRESREQLHSRTMAASPPIAAPWASASASMAAPPIPAPWSRAATTRCWRRSRPGRRRRRRRSPAWTGPCANTGSGASRPTCAFLEAVLAHPKFRANDYTTRFIDETPELFHFAKRRDRATKLLTYIADVTVNGHPEARGRATARRPRRARPSRRVFAAAPGAGHQQLLDALGPKASPHWMKAREARARHRHDDARRAPVAARHAHAHLRHRRRSRDAYARGLPQLFSLECWGGATFDVAMRFLNEDPWERLALIRERVPNILTADAAARRQRRRLHQLSRQCRAPFRPPARPRPAWTCSASSTASTGSRTCASRSTRWSRPASSPRARSAIPATSSTRTAAKYDLAYYVGARQGAGGGRLPHPRRQGHGRAAEAGRGARPDRRAEGGGRPADPPPHPRHVRHRRRDACWPRSRPGVDAVDAAMDAMSGTTSQPCLGSIVEALRHTERDTGLDPGGDPPASRFYWEAVRTQYAAFESDLQAPAHRRSICTRCRAGSSPTSRSRPARSASRRAGTRSPRPIAPPTTCSATSSR